MKIAIHNRKVNQIQARYPTPAASAAVLKRILFVTKNPNVLF
jgi:hypothetical protein